MVHSNSSSKQHKEVVFDEPVEAFNTERIIKTNKISNAFFSGLIFIIFVGISILISGSVKKCLQQAFAHKPISSYFNKKSVDGENSVSFGEPGHIFHHTHDIFEENFENMMGKSEKGKDPQVLQNNEENILFDTDSKRIFNPEIQSY